jgi:glycosyltransferase involved in cell wall biosynthesis
MTLDGKNSKAPASVAPTLSVIVPNYNHARFLPVALDAILSQTRPADEIIVIDDASTDDSIDVLQRYQARHSNFIVIGNRTNRGVIYNLNAGIRIAAGDYVYLAAADDRCYETLFEDGLALLEKFPQASLFTARCDIISETGECRGTLPSPLPLTLPGYLPSDVVRRKLLEDDGWFIGCSTIWRRRCLLDVGGFPADLGAFTDGYVSRLISLQHGSCFSPQVLSSWRRMEGGFAWEASTIEKTRQLIAAVRTRVDENRGLFPPGYVDIWARRHMFGVKRFALVEARRQARKEGVAKWLASCLAETVLSAWHFATLRARDLPAVLRRRLISPLLLRDGQTGDTRTMHSLAEPASAQTLDRK